MIAFSDREKLVVILGVVFLVVFFGYQLVIDPVFEKRQTLAQVLHQKQAAFDEMVLLQQQYASVSSVFDTRVHALANREKGFSLFAFLDSQAQDSGVKTNVAYMQPFSKEIEKSSYTLETVKFKLADVYLKELVNFLYRIESSENAVAISSLSLNKTGANKEKLDAIIEARTLMVKENS